MELLIDKLVRRVSNETQWENVRAELEMQHKVNKFDNIALDIVFARSKAGLLARDDEESVPVGYCDDLLDYWPWFPRLPPGDRRHLLPGHLPHGRTIAGEATSEPTRF